MKIQIIINTIIDRAYNLIIGCGLLKVFFNPMGTLRREFVPYDLKELEDKLL